MKTISFPALNVHQVMADYPLELSRVRQWWVELVFETGGLHIALDYAQGQLARVPLAYRAWLLSVLVEHRDEILQAVERRYSVSNCPLLPGLGASASASGASAAMP